MYKFVVVLALVAACAAQLPHDTVEVALEKAAHLDAVVATHARNLGFPIIPSSVPLVRTTPTWKAWEQVPAVDALPTQHFFYDDVKFRHNLINQIPAPIAPVHAPLKTLLPSAPYTAPYPAPLVPAVKLYDDGQYHQDITGRYIKHFVPAPQN